MKINKVYCLFEQSGTFKNQIKSLCGVIDWPWIWVLSPIWIPLIIAGVVLLAVFGWKAIKDKLDDKHLDAEAKKFKEERERKKKIAKLCRDIAERSNT